MQHRGLALTIFGFGWQYQGASVVPAAGKERQFKIMKGSMVYYLRTISRDYRQPWLDAIHESIRVYNTSVQKAAGGADYGTALIPQQSVPSVAISINLLLQQ